MVECRCAVLNHLSGPSAADYTRQHLDVMRETPMRTTTYRCPETKIEWIEEYRIGDGDSQQRRLRRLH